ncbi:nicotinate-nucleotide adenylyltransferase [Colwellia sp. 6_MG-2023]|uniref:nicotinate-nucleotide adenylyltransferase n=1 Tax=Colwellia sp. 6_MG-2023 TaxID=3062676 RepID=UPI0026E29460|nr:nicotinate-nucleotide adenylyltransferase [Colwellia sp. 6_MG-2023]MDO6488803.1 nicotinate-nucleotide adenylyltransferase [Colwellia sp. 6_MG-2023]
MQRTVNDIGILGGTFNPIHLGHTLPAKAVAEHLSLDKVLVIPASIPPHKATPNVSAKQRATMVKLACESESIFSCDERELHRSGYSYTVDTLKELALSYPNSRLYFIMGLDSLLTFTQWHKYQEILSLCHLVVNTRPNYQLENLNHATQILLNEHQVSDVHALKQKKYGGILLLPCSLPNNEKHLNINLSSSEIRQRLINKQSCQKLLNPKVLDLINKNMLYR